MPEYTAWITAQIRKICETYKNRTAGSKSVCDCMHEMETQLRDWCDDVAAEPFTLHPHAFMGSVPLQASLCICGVICFLLSYFLSSAAAAWISAVLFLAAISVWLLEYVFYGRAFDFLFPKKESVNIYAERKARVESRQRIILCGHADAAFEMSFFVHLKAWMIYVLMVGADLGMFICLLFGVLYATGAVSVYTAAIFSVIEAVLLVVDISWLFFIRWRVIADGANDNLTGCLITDGEESGLRGAMAFAEAHRQELIDDHTMFHGYRSGAERDFSGGLPFGIESGFNVLLVDQRAHGKSGGRCLTFGIKERHDCLSWVEYVCARTKNTATQICAKV